MATAGRQDEEIDMATVSPFLKKQSVLYRFLPTLLLFVLALGLRLEMTGRTIVNVPVRADARQYYAVAYNILTYGVISTVFPDGSKTSPRPDSLRCPGYPSFMAPFVVYPPTQKMVNRIKLAQAIVGTLTVLFGLFLLRSFLPSPLALFGAALIALSPHLLASEVYLLTETLFTFLVTLFAWSFSRLALHPSLFRAFLVGLFLGATVLVRETTTYLYIFLAFGFAFLLPRRQLVGLLLCAMIGYFIAYGPWVLRSRLNPDIASHSNQALKSIQGGAYPNVMYRDIPQSHGIPHRFDPKYHSIENWSDLFKELQRRFTTEPERYLRWYIIGKPLVFLSWDIVAGAGDVYVYPVTRSPFFDNKLFQGVHVVMHFLHWPLMALAVLGVLIVWFPSAHRLLPSTSLAVARFLSLIVLYFIFLHMVVTPLPRYATPIRPILFGLAMLTLAMFWNSWSEKNTHQTMTVEKRT
ncbi:MAG: hypothetical protein D3914_07330 [Candidatus Electrothrix sp. LOE2]|nr:hypothetical protein [Candidatus Electrothrix sp. LOE2]